MNNYYLIINYIILICIILLSFSAGYNLLFAFFALFNKKRRVGRGVIITQQKKILVLIPAHNEELLIGRLLDSLEGMDYPKEKYDVLVIVDNCTDRTDEIVRDKDAQLLVRNDKNKLGKGQALKWAISQKVYHRYDAVLVIDADNIVDSGLLRAVNIHLNNDEVAIQCNNGVANPNDTWFTRVMNIARVINNELFYQGRYVLGLSNIFTGNGMCLASDLLTRISWESEGISEDKEQSVRLISQEIFIAFAIEAKLYAQESKFLGQAFSQRLRWAGGKFKHSRKYGLRLFLHGIKEGNFKLSEAILPLILPNHSLLANMTFFLLLLVIFSPFNWAWRNVFIIWIAIVLLSQLIYLVLGFFVAKAKFRTVVSFFMAPVFLIWKAFIDLIAFLGFRSDIWARTKRIK